MSPKVLKTKPVSKPNLHIKMKCDISLKDFDKNYLKKHKENLHKKEVEVNNAETGDVGDKNALNTVEGVIDVTNTESENTNKEVEVVNIELQEVSTENAPNFNLILIY